MSIPQMPQIPQPPQGTQLPPVPQSPQSPSPVRAAQQDVQWRRCASCGSFIYGKRLDRNLKVCPECGFHFRIPPDVRIGQLADPGSFEAFPDTYAPRDLLGFTDSKPYPDRLRDAQARTGRQDAILTGRMTVRGRPVVVAVLDFTFMGGSMGAVVGEAVAAAARHALDRRLPLLLIAASGGARMQEGALSLMQMAKTAQWVAALREARLPVINLNTDPTFGGVSASFAMLGDVILAEPGALIGFAGPQVIRNTIRQELPPGFQSAEFLLEHGMIDAVVPRENQREQLARLLALLGPSLPQLPDTGGPEAIRTTPVPSTRTTRETVSLARDIGRPTALEYFGYVFDDFVSLHGDRAFGDDHALVGGVARFGGQSLVVLGHQKGHDTAELVRSNFGMPNPEGYRKALRLMRFADRFGLPVVNFIDTPGAFPGIEAEQRGQSVAIADCILELSRLRVPVVSVVTGEGGSGGALALGVADTVLILENAYYSVISPEGCSTILFGTAEHADRAADALRLTASELLRLGVVDGVVPEPPDGAHTAPHTTALTVKNALARALAPLLDLDGEQLVAARRRRYDRFGDPQLQPVVDWETHDEH
ncbi:acetyl-CoA carboxylase carboxyltransferase subunit alpha [Streptomyces sp. NPDC088794]|uniref:acetyl-CoA carboxylase carboxyltransferase subunit alpha n=1 Tax=Streptomyces sp. NPDC088794 TaxID=3365902 RepID=UPI0037F5EAD1